MDDKSIKSEYKRLYDILERAEVPQKQREVLAPVIDNLAWMKVKLDQTREEIKDASVVCEYDNGGGQSGTRENPIFKGYVSLWRSYMIGLEKFTSYLPKEMQEEVQSETADILSQVQRMKKAT